MNQDEEVQPFLVAAWGDSGGGDRGLQIELLLQ
jgi:hypothetical protein